MCIRDRYDDVPGGTGPHIFYGVQGSESYINDAAHSGALDLAVVLELESAFLDDDHFRVLDAVRGVGRGPGRLRGLVHCHGLASGQRAAEDIAPHGAVG